MLCLTVLTWFRKRRRKKLLAKPFPAEWEAIIQRNVAHDRWLAPEERARLIQAIEESEADIANGDYADGADFIEQLRSKREAASRKTGSTPGSSARELVGRKPTCSSHHVHR